MAIEDRIKLLEVAQDVTDALAELRLSASAWTRTQEDAYYRADAIATLIYGGRSVTDADAEWLAVLVDADGSVHLERL